MKETEILIYIQKSIPIFFLPDSNNVYVLPFSSHYQFSVSSYAFSLYKPKRQLSKNTNILGTGMVELGKL